MHRGQHRLRYLDGLRGVAILLVLIWHYLGPVYAQTLPYGDRYWRLPVVRDGWMGVEIFFLISGFVIFMTIERCDGFVDFMLRRWLRLFPAMLIASLLMLALNRSEMLHGPYSGARAIDAIPGLLFVDPAFLHAATHIDFGSLDGVFWTLYLEAAFYIVFGLAYFRLGWPAAIVTLLVLAGVDRFLPGWLAAAHAPHAMQRALEPLDWAKTRYFAWFASGALFYKAREGGRLLFALAVATGLLAALIYDQPQGMNDHIRILLVAIALGFAVVQAIPPLQAALANPPLLFLGFVSYPLYLVHNNLGLGLLAGLAGQLPHLRPEALLLPVVLIVVMLAWLIARFGEPAVAQPLKRLLRRAGLRHG